VPAACLSLTRLKLDCAGAPPSRHFDIDQPNCRQFEFERLALRQRPDSRSFTPERDGLALVTPSLPKSFGIRTALISTKSCSF
jgi:hypothetical protein